MLEGLLQDPEQRHADEMALLAVVGGFVFFGLSIYAVVYQGHPFDPQTYGIGFGTTIAGCCVGMGLKAKMGG